MICKTLTADTGRYCGQACCRPFSLPAAAFYSPFTHIFLLYGIFLSKQPVIIIMFIRIQRAHKGAEAVVSFNYFPIVSMICNTCQIPYYAWVYDCPHFTLYAKQIGLPCNHIGIFDREMVAVLLSCP